MRSAEYTATIRVMPRAIRSRDLRVIARFRHVGWAFSLWRRSSCSENCDDSSSMIGLYRASVGFSDMFTCRFVKEIF